MVGQVTWLVQGVQVGKYYMKSFGRDMIDLIRFRCKSIIGHLAAESTGSRSSAIELAPEVQIELVPDPSSSPFFKAI